MTITQSKLTMSNEQSTMNIFAYVPSNQATVAKIRNRNPPIAVIVRSEIRPAISRPPTTAIAVQIPCPKIAPAVTPIGLFDAARVIVAI